jgi:hypothetical protein
VGGARGRASALDQRKLDENASSERGRAKMPFFFNSLVGVSLALIGVGLWSFVTYHLRSVVITQLLLVRLCVWRPLLQSP